MMVTTIEKVGPEFILHLDEKDTPIKYNVETRTITSYTGRTVKRMPSGVLTDKTLGYRGDYYNRNNDGDHETKLRGILKIINVHSRGYMNNVDMNAICLFWIYRDLWEDIDHLPNECPKGYIPWVKDNNRGISKASLTDFKEEQLAKGFSTLQREALEILEPVWRKYYAVRRLSDRIKHNSKEQAHKLCKILKVSMKSFSWSTVTDLERFLQICDRCDNWADIVNTDRDFAFNKVLIEQYLNRHKDELIRIFEEKGKAITELTYGGLGVVIPLSIADMIDEGNQQHNCVGRFYPDRVQAGDSFIYFIRSLDDMTKSYITCEFQPAWKRTTQALASCNNNFHDTNATQLIKMVDDILKEVFPAD